MTMEELSELEKHASVAINEPLLIKPEEEKIKEFLKEVEKASRILWKKAMEAGSKGLAIEDLVQDVVEEGITPATAKAAIERLEQLSQVRKVGWDRVVATASVQTLAKSDGATYEVTVEKIHPGSAVVLINDRWRARLAHEDFEGPPSLVKKNAKFKARGMLYHDNGTLCFRVQEVTQILS
jgi:Fanconi anemia group M protein